MSENTSLRGALVMALQHIHLCAPDSTVEAALESELLALYAAPSEVGGGVAMIAAERARHVSVEGWTPEHDDEHDTGAMAFAASVYARMAGSSEKDRRFLRSFTPMFWPWDHAWFKPSRDDTPEGRASELAKAGALCAAEIDRLQRPAMIAATEGEPK